jgi:hypothetical protein
MHTIVPNITLAYQNQGKSGFRDLKKRIIAESKITSKIKIIPSTLSRRSPGSKKGQRFKVIN